MEAAQIIFINSWLTALKRQSFMQVLSMIISITVNILLVVGVAQISQNEMSFNKSPQGFIRKRSRLY